MLPAFCVETPFGEPNSHAKVAYLRVFGGIDLINRLQKPIHLNSIIL